MEKYNVNNKDGWELTDVFWDGSIDNCRYIFKREYYKLFSAEEFQRMLNLKEVEPRIVTR